jgi:hypothetical protein
VAIAELHDVKPPYLRRAHEAAIRRAHAGRPIGQTIASSGRVLDSDGFFAF